MSDPLVEDYRRAGFGAHLEPGRWPVLLVIDAVQAYLRTGSPLYAGVEAAVRCAIDLADKARSVGVPVVLTRVAFAADGRDGGLFFRKVPALRAFAGDSPDGAFAAGLHQPADLVVTKQYASAFFGTGLASTLTALRADTVLVTGLTTSGCVRASATDALNHGFVPMVVRDATGDRDAAVHEANLFDLRQKYAEVIDAVAAATILDGAAWPR